MLQPLCDLIDGGFDRKQSFVHVAIRSNVAVTVILTTIILSFQAQFQMSQYLLLVVTLSN
jgi:hypothetical protein